VRRRWSWVPFAVGVSLLAPAFPWAGGLPAQAEAPTCSDGRSCPNIVLILTDDQRWDELENMPNVRTLLISQGVLYTNGLEPNSLCCPSRSTILSGQFSNHTGVWRNIAPYGGFEAFKPHESQTLAVWLRNAGYRTGLVGKYMNGFSANAGKVSTLLARPGWDYWTSFVGGDGEGPGYYDYDLLRGATQTTPGTFTHFGDPANPSSACAAYGTCYSTTVFGQEARTFLAGAPTSQPFFLDLAVNAPHGPFTPAPQDTNSLPTCTSGATPPGCYSPITLKGAGQCPPQDGLPPYCSENIGNTAANDVSWARALTTSGKGFNTGNRRYQEQTLLELDRQIGLLVDAIVGRGQLSDTLFIFTSDNSLSGGSHRWTAKETAWDEAGHIPMVVRYDPLTAAVAGSIEPRIVLNADIAPTVLAVAGVPDPVNYTFDGQPFPTFNPSWDRTGFPLEHLTGGSSPPTYCGIRTTPDYVSPDGSVTGAWKYVRYQNLPGTGYPPYEEELFNLSVDPFEMNSLAGNAGSDGTTATLKADAEALCSPPPPGFSWTGTAPGPPQVTGFNPASGPVGTSVTIAGSGFSGVNQVTFNGTAATQFTVNSDTQVTATVPAGASTGSVCVTAGGGTGCSGSSFVVTQSSGIFRVGQIGTAANTSGTTQKTLSVTVGAGGVPSGDTVILGLAGQGAAHVTSVNDTAGNIYHVDVIRSYAGTGPCTSALISAPVTQALSQGQTITVTLDKGNAWGFVADDWRGITGTLDRTGQADSNSAASASVSVSTVGSTTQSNEAVASATCVAGVSGVTAGNGYVLTVDLQITSGTNKRELGAEYMTVGATGTQAAAFRLGSAKNWSAVIATYA
jgi:N-acetylglucosamine-6-sulfatase